MIKYLSSIFINRCQQRQEKKKLESKDQWMKTASNSTG